MSRVTQHVSRVTCWPHAPVLSTCCDGVSSGQVQATFTRPAGDQMPRCSPVQCPVSRSSVHTVSGVQWLVSTLCPVSRCRYHWSPHGNISRWSHTRSGIPGTRHCGYIIWKGWTGPTAEIFMEYPEIPTQSYIDLVGVVAVANCFNRSNNLQSKEQPYMEQVVTVYFEQILKCRPIAPASHAVSR